MRLTGLGHCDGKIAACAVARHGQALRVNSDACMVCQYPAVDIKAIPMDLFDFIGWRQFVVHRKHMAAAIRSDMLGHSVIFIHIAKNVATTVKKETAWCIACCSFVRDALRYIVPHLHLAPPNRHHNVLNCPQ